MEEKKKKTIEDYMVAVPREELEADEPSDFLQLDEPTRRIWLTIIVYLVLFLIIGVTGCVVYQKYQNREILSIEDKTEEGISVDDSSKPVSKYVYAVAEDGLNLRENADADSSALVLIPYKTKLEVMEETDDWVKVEYEGKTGWCSRELTLQP